MTTPTITSEILKQPPHYDYGSSEVNERPYRLLDEDEIVLGFKALSGIECMEDVDELVGWRRGYKGCSKLNTYRTKLTRAELRAARGLPPEAVAETKEPARPTGKRYASVDDLVRHSTNREFQAIYFELKEQEAKYGVTVQPSAPVASETTTPRTDAAYADVGRHSNTRHMLDELADFARTLERELTAMTAERDKYRNMWLDRVSDIAEARSQRDTAQAEAARLREEIGVVITNFDRALEIAKLTREELVEQDKHVAELTAEVAKLTEDNKALRVQGVENLKLKSELSGLKHTAVWMQNSLEEQKVEIAKLTQERDGAVRKRDYWKRHYEEKGKPAFVIARELETARQQPSTAHEKIAELEKPRNKDEQLQSNLADSMIDSLRAQLQQAQAACEFALEGLNTAWGVIANAGAGNWARESREWQEAAVKWRDEVFHKAIQTGFGASILARLTELEKIVADHARDWADDDTAIKSLCAKHGIETENNGTDEFKTMVQCVEELSGKFAGLEKERDNATSRMARHRAEFEKARNAADRIHKELLAERQQSATLREELDAARKDSARLDFLDAVSHDRCVTIGSLPKGGLRHGDRWTVHFNGIGYVGHSESTPPNIREAIDAAIAATKENA